MKSNKIGAMFLISVLALAGIGVSYAGFTDEISILGTANTATVSLVVETYSGTDVYKVWGGDTAPDDEIHIERWIENRPTIADVQANFPDSNVELISWAFAEPGTTADVDMTFHNLFPCVDFTADFIVHYTGSIPAKVNNTLITGDPLLEDLWDLGEITVAGYFCHFNETSDEWETHYDEPVGIGTQLHYCDYVIAYVTIHIPQDNIWQNMTGTFSASVEVIQWNEGPTPQ